MFNNTNSDNWGGGGPALMVISSDAIDCVVGLESPGAITTELLIDCELKKV